MPPFASVPSEQETVDVPEQLPCVVEAETKSVLEGNGSLTVTFEAVSGPELWIDKV